MSIKPSHNSGSSHYPVRDEHNRQKGACTGGTRYTRARTTRQKSTPSSSSVTKDSTSNYLYMSRLTQTVTVCLTLYHISERVICNAVAPEKDVDGFHIVNIGKLCLDQDSIIPATAGAVWEIIKRTGIETFGKNVVVAGRSKNVGMPISMLLHTDGNHERPGGDATVTITHRYTPKELLKCHTQLADIVIVAAGIPKLITADMIKEGATVIDVGINYIEDPVTGKTMLIGDVDFEEVKKKADFITPVPGGVGPVTVAMLLKNTLMTAKKLIF
ncbi:bifunctional methylenetetrahydrofolate dehydrogenase cyclohydrolase 2 [Pelobates cultripes]|uniref:Bifunctional methylenetetrahydrofolate dehydrogenase cyclohydrolase 2, partial n=1 Tax=Pelobates cultripes TaxID=61616 RepID=A0AAD1SIU3_PELCU|nr:bifunctional methylenetetrahydrofolate dehydrogenase cyclohydrolase 2 [Pelobates cultripes]